MMLLACLVDVQGTGYGVCAPGQVPLTSKPCELGATARDLYGNNLTSAVRGSLGHW
jgi:hypothetical protein